jgi:hypothetical protein
MQLSEIIRTVGKPVIDLAHESNVSHFRLQNFIHGRCELRPEEQRAVLDVLLQHGTKVERALAILREVAIA